VTADTAKRWKTSRGFVFIVDELCKGCTFCIEFCPTDALQKSTDFNKHGYHYPLMARPQDCVNCGYCQLLCPDFAIWSQREGDPD
jgi:2-oxoglutarate ferredoxin oxidoreductase subunit delta